jgi:histidinol phosphatase-like PHP family hydrolase
MKILFHNHSTFSYDGEISMEAWRAYGRAHGLDAILLAEHADDFDEGKMRRYITACRAHSGGDLTIIPALEYRLLHNIHVVVVGSHDVLSFPQDDAEAFVGAVARHQAIMVLAHPFSVDSNVRRTAYYRYIEEHAHGIEVWNARQDARFFPDYRVLAHVKELSRRRSRPFFLIGGTDMHSLVQLEFPPYIVNELLGGAGDTKSIDMRSLFAEQRNQIKGRYCVLHNVPDGISFTYKMVLRILAGGRCIRNAVKSVIGGG